MHILSIANGQLWRTVGQSPANQLQSQFAKELIEREANSRPTTGCKHAERESQSGMLSGSQLWGRGGGGGDLAPPRYLYACTSAAPTASSTRFWTTPPTTLWPQSGRRRQSVRHSPPGGNAGARAGGRRHQRHAFAAISPRQSRVWLPELLFHDLRQGTPALRRRPRTPELDQDLGQMWLHGRMIELSKIKLDAQYNGSLVPASWELVCLPPGQTMRVLASHVASFDVAADGTVVYTNGYDLTALRGGVVQKVGRQELVEGVAVG